LWDFVKVDSTLEYFQEDSRLVQFPIGVLIDIHGLNSFGQALTVGVWTFR